MIGNAEKTIIENMIDARGLAAVLDAIADIATEKSDHIQASYATDSRMDADASRWKNAARAVRALANRVPIKAVSR